MQTAKQILHGYLRLYRSISEEYRGQFGTVTLTFPQTLVLSLLSAEGPMPISELAKATGSANSTISGVLRIPKPCIRRRCWIVWSRWN